MSDCSSRTRAMTRSDVEKSLFQNLYSRKDTKAQKGFGGFSLRLWAQTSFFLFRSSWSNQS